MAVSNLLPRKAKGNRTRSQTLQARFAYDETEEKTGGKVPAVFGKRSGETGGQFQRAAA